MALSESLTTTDGDTHEMAGVLPADVDDAGALSGARPRGARRTGGTAAADVGGDRRGHEFHYSSATPARRPFAFDVVRGDGIDGEHDGLTEYRTIGTYCHRHGESGAFDRLRCLRSAI